MDKYSNPDVFIVLGGFVAIFLIGALLAEVAVFIAKMLGYEDVADKPNVDFMQRLQDGEVLDADNIFSDE